MAVEIFSVTTKKNLKKFVEFPYNLYRNYPDWVPPLKSEVYKLFDKKRNPFLEHSLIQPFIAIKEGKVVGRIAAIIDDNYINFHNKKIGYFGFFECIDNESIADALFKESEKFLIQNGMNEVIGPLNASTNEECGFLLEGFDSTPLLMMTYTPRYYLRLAEHFRYKKAKDLFAFHMDLQNPLPEKVNRIAERIKKRNQITITHIDLKHFNRDLKKVKGIYNSAWEANWGFVPMTEAEIDDLAKDMKDLVVPELLQFAEIDGETVAFMWIMPDYNYVLKKMNGKLNPIIFLKEKKNIKWFRLITFGIIEKYRKQGIDALFFSNGLETARKMGYTDAEFSWILEENVLVHRAAKAMGGELYKKYRIYGKQLKEEK
jgi:hypothetical protein